MGVVVAVFVLFELHPMELFVLAQPQAQLDVEGVRLGDLVHALQPAADVGQGEGLVRAIRSDGPDHRLARQLAAR